MYICLAGRCPPDIPARRDAKITKLPKKHLQIRTNKIAFFDIRTHRVTRTETGRRQIREPGRNGAERTVVAPCTCTGGRIVSAVGLQRCASLLRNPDWIFAAADSSIFSGPGCFSSAFVWHLFRDKLAHSIRPSLRILFAVILCSIFLAAIYAYSVVLGIIHASAYC